MAASPETPLADVFDLGALSVPQDDPDTDDNIVTRDFNMPYDGFTYLIDPEYGAANVIGFRLLVNGSVVLPANYGPDDDDSDYIVGGDNSAPMLFIEPVPEGTNVEARIENGSQTAPLDLGLNLTVTNFDPRELGAVGGGL